MFRTPRTITALLLLTLVAYVQCDDSADRILIKVFKHFVEELQSLETANERVPVTEDSDGESTDLDSLADDDVSETDDDDTASSETDDSRSSQDADGYDSDMEDSADDDSRDMEDSADDDSRDMEDSADDEDNTLEAPMEPATNDLLDLAKEMGVVAKIPGDSGLWEVLPLWRHRSRRRHSHHQRERRRTHRRNRRRHHRSHRRHRKCEFVDFDEFETNEEGTFSLEENNNGKTGLENLAGDDDNETDDKVTASSENDDSRTSPDVDEDSSDDTSDMEESVDDEEDHPIKTLAENLFDPSVNDLLDLAKEMRRIPEARWLSDLRMVLPRRHKRHRRHSRRHRRHHKKRRNRNHNRHEEHGECSTIGTNEYECNNGEESVTVSYDESLSEYKMTLMVKGTEKLEGSAQIDKKICGEDSYCIEVAEVGGEKCVKMTSPEDKVIGCFTGGSSGTKKIESDTLIFEKHGRRR